VDTIQNATYYWYKKTTPTDSVLLGNGLSWNMPFFQPEDIGQYVCKMVLNSGCITRLARFDLFGCDDGVLAAGLKLHGRKTGKTHQLYWNSLQDGTTAYSIQRKANADREFISIGKVDAAQGINFYTDARPAQGLNQYRLKLKLGDKEIYTNVVSLFGGDENFSVHPNPVKNAVTISINSSTSADYDIELLNASGRIVFSKQIKNVREAVISYQRNYALQPGIYLLRIKNRSTNATEIRKLLFE
jgi:hypothetical protein